MVFSEAMVVASSEGTVLFIPNLVVTTRCTLDMVHFPFDEQTCILRVNILSCFLTKYISDHLSQ